MFLLDTDVISGFRKRRAHPGLLAWAEVNLVGSPVISAATVGEIERGATYVELTDPSRAAEIRSWLRGILATSGTVVLPFGVAEAQIWGAISATPALWTLANETHPRPYRMPRAGADFMIAATAITTGRTLVTGNIRHMLEIHRHFPLPGLIDPFTGVVHVGPVASPETPVARPNHSER